MRLQSRLQLQAFVADLPIPAERKEVVLSELEDHAFCELAEAESDGLAPTEAEARAFAALGDLVLLRARLVTSERRFELTFQEATWRALGIATGPLVSTLCAVAIAEIGPGADPELLMVVTFTAPVFAALFWPGIVRWPSLRSEGSMHRWGRTGPGRVFFVLAIALSLLPTLGLQAYLYVVPWGHFMPVPAVSYAAWWMALTMIGSLAFLEWASNHADVKNSWLGKNLGDLRNLVRPR